ncbi:stage II sporulation protein P [Paenibacillus marinisediminis]
MKSTFRTFNIARWKHKWAKLLTAGRTFLWMTVATAVFIIVISIGGIVGQQLQTSPASAMKGLASHLSAQWFVQLLALELPTMNVEGGEEISITKRDVANMLFRLVTNVNPLDPKTLLAGELPGAASDSSVLLRAGSGNRNSSGPADFSPLPGDEGRDHGGAPDPGDLTPVNEEFEQVDPKSGRQPNDTSSSEGKLDKIVYIYHSHNRESWNPELDKESSNPNDAKVNITKVGKYLQEQLEKRGIGAVHSDKDYASTVKGYSWNFSYKYSGDSVKEAMNKNDGLQFFFDLHRDAARRKNTTVTINGKDYAKVYFIIGQLNPNWKQNEKFAASLHNKLEKQYPGISRGIFGKNASTGNGEYNQSLSPNSVVVEIGGVDNTLEESYRTAEVLSELIADLVHEKQGVQPVNQPGQKQDLSKLESGSVQKQISNTGG